MRAKIITGWRNTLNTVINAVLPPRCPITGTLVGVNGTVAPEFWTSLTFIQKPLCTCCGMPFPFGASDDMLCGDCLQEPPVFDHARAALKYDDASATAILRLKYADATILAPIFATWMTNAAEDFLTPGTILISVPLHRRRLWTRRYNQAALLADQIAKRAKLTHWPLALKRVRATEPQGRKSHQQRKDNLRGAFAIDPAYTETLKGKNIILVDDVFTSGATLSACATILKDNGAAQIIALTTAKVVKN